MIFETPVIVVPDWNQAELDEALSQMFQRSHATERWLRGEEYTDNLLDLLDAHRIDVFDLVNAWENGDLA